MGLKANLKARQAVALQSRGNSEAALQAFEEAVAGGTTDARAILSYTVLLIRKGEYAKARELLVKIQKNPAIGPDQKKQLFVNYAVCVYKMGEIEKGIALLERQHQHTPCGIVYETLGYLYVESGNAEKALSYNQEALEYDDEDSIVMDNLGQTYYRLLNDKATAKTYFDKAIALRPSQIDTLYFLAQYDIEAGDKAAAKEKLERALEGRFSALNHANKPEIERVLATL